MPIIRGLQNGAVETREAGNQSSLLPAWPLTYLVTSESWDLSLPQLPHLRTQGWIKASFSDSSPPVLHFTVILMTSGKEGVRVLSD